MDRVRCSLECERAQPSEKDPGLNHMETSLPGVRASCLPAQEWQHPLTLQLVTSSVLGVLVVMGGLGSSVQHLEPLCPLSLF